MEWAAGYELQDYGNTIKVTSFLNNLSTEPKMVRLDYELVVDGKHYPPKGIITLMGLPPATIGGERTIPGQTLDFIWIIFDTPPGRAPDQEAKAFMLAKDLRLYWRSYDVQCKLTLF